MSSSCPHCDKLFSFKGNLERHIECVHNKDSSVSCDYCQKVMRKDNLKRHVKSCKTNPLEDSQEHEKQLTCEVCAKSFKNKKTLSGQRKSHDEKDSQFVCYLNRW